MPRVGAGGGAAPTVGRLAREAFEHSREVGLCLEADAERDVDKSQAGVPKQLLRSLDSPAQDILMWPSARRDPEQGGEVHTCQACRIRQLGQRDGPGKMSADVVDDPLQPPFLKRRPAAVDGR